MAFGSISQNDTSIHQYKINALNSDEIIDFSHFAGKKMLIVNVASKCGFTNQYEGLQELYAKHQDDLVIIGFPCNQFGGQEPGTETEIATFCSSTYGVSFPLTEKVEVKGPNVHPIYQWLTSKDLNGKDDFEISWNFNKFLLDEEGHLVAHFSTQVEPLADEIISML